VARGGLFNRRRAIAAGASAEFGAVPVDRRQRIRSLEIRGTPDIRRRAPLHDRDGVIRFQHRRKISSILIRNTVVPIAIRTTLGSCLAIEGVKSPKTRSCYEYHPPGRSKTVRTAMGRSIFPADGTGRTSKPAAGQGEPAPPRRGTPEYDAWMAKRAQDAARPKTEQQQPK
jgi:hypothetical protein